MIRPVVNYIEVLIRGDVVGRITRNGNRYGFTYYPDISRECFVSLTMPVRTETYYYNGLHPAFDMSQPEGALKAALVSTFAKTIEMDDFGLLALTGHDRIGRLRYRAQPALPPVADKAGYKTGELNAVLVSEVHHPLFTELVKKFGDGAGVAGVQPKVLARLLDDKDHGVGHTRRKLIKTSGSQYPYLALNESLCLRVAREAGLDVPDWEIMGEGDVLVVDRFDYNSSCNGYYGFEELASLAGLQAKDKYTGELQKLIALLGKFLSPDNRQQGLRDFFTLFVLNNLLRNGDAHLKNYGVRYTGIDDVHLAPVYDIVTTTAYITNDQPAMSVFGKTAWMDRKGLSRVGTRIFRMPPALVANVIDSVTRAIETTAAALIEAIDKYHRFHGVGFAMLTAWNDGIKSLDAKKDRDKCAIHTGIDDLLRVCSSMKDVGPGKK